MGEVADGGWFISNRNDRVRFFFFWFLVRESVIFLVLSRMINSPALQIEMHGRAGPGRLGAKPSKAHPQRARFLHFGRKNWKSVRLPLRRCSAARLPSRMSLAFLSGVFRCKGQGKWIVFVHVFESLLSCFGVEWMRIQLIPRVFQTKRVAIEQRPCESSAKQLRRWFKVDAPEEFQNFGSRFRVFKLNLFGSLYYYSFKLSPHQ